MFQGSRHTGADQHFRLLEAAGATSINGTTDFDRTNYFETVPSNELELALWIESDRMGFLLDTLDQAALTGQIDVVRNERRQSVEGAPYGIVEEEVWRQLFPQGHPYHANVIGSHADIESASLGDVREFFSEYYTPEQCQPGHRRRCRYWTSAGAGRTLLRFDSGRTKPCHGPRRRRPR